MAQLMGRSQTGWVVFEEQQSGETTPGSYPITIWPEMGENYESMLYAVLPGDLRYKGVFERRDDADAWVENWRKA
jgi:hypothetical protein